MQQMFAYAGGQNLVLTLPPPHEHALPGVEWGRFDELFTPAYWKGQAWQHEDLGTYAPGPLGRDLAEEVSACVLGGFGIPAELGLAAFGRLRDMGMLSICPKAADLELALSTPFSIGNRLRRYRFPRVKARVLAGALNDLPRINQTLSDRDLRDA